MVAAACNDVDADRGEGDADSPRRAESPLPFAEVIMRGRAEDGDDGGSELRSGAMSMARTALTSDVDKGGRLLEVKCHTRQPRAVAKLPNLVDSQPNKMLRGLRRNGGVELRLAG